MANQEERPTDSDSGVKDPATGGPAKGLAEQVADYDLQERIAESLEHIADSLALIARKLDQLGQRGGPTGQPPQQQRRFRGDYGPRQPRDDRPRDDRSREFGGPDRRGGPPGRYRGPGRRWRES